MKRYFAAVFKLYCSSCLQNFDAVGAVRVQMPSLLDRNTGIVIPVIIEVGFWCFQFLENSS